MFFRSWPCQSASVFNGSIMKFDNPFTIDFVQLISNICQNV